MRFHRVRIGPLRIGLLALLFVCCGLGRLAAQTGTFIDRRLATDLRVATFNVYLNTIFPAVDPTQAAKFVRIVDALDVDIFNLQEIESSAAEVVELMNDIAPLEERTWYARKGRRSVIASKYPLSMLASSIDPESDRPPAIALVDLPDAQFGSDFYIINHHYVAGFAVPRRAQRQRNSDATIRWIRDARTPGGSVDLPPGTPIAVVGDMNNAPGTSVINTLVTGDIINESTYGPDSPPDWDGSSFTEARPLINGSGPEDYTFRYSADKSRIDHIIYSDSVLDVPNKFVLNTVDMSPAELAATGLQAFDVTIDSIGEAYDHLPVVTDFRLFDPTLVGDMDFDRDVDFADIDDFVLGLTDPTDYEQRYGVPPERKGDLDRDEDLDYDDILGFAAILTGGLKTVPEPASLLLVLAGIAGLVGARHRVT